MADSNMVKVYKKVIVNNNSWVLFEHGTVVIFLPKEVLEIRDLQEEAVNRLRNLQIKEHVVVGEWLGQSMGWIVNCGNDHILNYCSHDGDYENRYTRIVEASKAIPKDQQELKIVHIEKRG